MYNRLIALKGRLFSRRIILMLFILPVFTAVQAQQKFIIQGKIEGVDNGTRIILARFIDGKSGQDPDTTLIKNGTYKFQGEVSRPVRVSLYIPQTSMNNPSGLSYSRTFFLCPGLTAIAGKDIGSATISGNPQEHEYEEQLEELHRLLKPWTDSLGRLNVKTIKDFTSKDALKTAQANAEKFHPQFYKIEQDFIRKHANSYVSLDMLESEARVIQYPDDFEGSYILLSSHLKNTPEGRLMGERAMLAVKYAIGKPALDFSQVDSKGNNVSLASLKGKYILIDFWASWCGPCRTEYPYLKEAYKQFKNKGFEIVGVSLDNDKSAWLNAIRDNSFMWPELCDLKGRKNEVALAYGVTGIPANFLIDPAGNIIAKNMYGDDLINKLCEVIKTN